MKCMRDEEYHQGKDVPVEQQTEVVPETPEMGNGLEGIPDVLDLGQIHPRIESGNGICVAATGRFRLVLFFSESGDFAISKNSER